MDITLKPLFLEERYFLNKGNLKGISIGIKPSLDGDFTPTMRIVDARGFAITFSPNQIDQFFHMLTSLPIFKKFRKTSHEEILPFSPNENFNIAKTEYNEFVYVITNVFSDGVKSMAIAYGTLKRILQLEPIIRKRYLELDVETLSDVLSLFEERLLQNRDEEEEEFDERVGILLDAYCENPKLLYENLPAADKHVILNVFIDTKTNFEDFLFQYLRRHDYAYYTLSHLLYPLFLPEFQ